LQAWALSALGDECALQESTLAPVAGDASNRRYFRLQRGSRSDIAVVAPPATEKNEAFLAVRQLLQDAGVRVPGLRAADLERGYLLLEDLGDELLLSDLADETVERHYRSALQLLHQLSLVDLAEARLPDYDEALLTEELSRFPAWFVRDLLGYPLQADESTMLQRLDQVLVASALEQPRVLVHRDFHSRNLMLQSGGALAVIDFQDAVLGPLSYDLVSLLRDCYVRWPPERVRHWALAYLEQLQQHGLAPGVGEAQFLRWFDLMGLQRHIKVLGTFARLYLRDGKVAYLEDLPLVIAYVREVSAGYAGEIPELAAFQDWFEARLMPLVSERGWSRAT
jgi:aminoglycoside/choline kinase family phosphotransferase